MNTAFVDDYIIEPERYELIDIMPDVTWSRRDFFRITGGGLIVALLLSDQSQAQPPRQGGGRGASPQEIRRPGCTSVKTTSLPSIPARSKSAKTFALR